MNFFTDSYFCIGQLHVGAGKPCQDYAGAECRVDDLAYAIVSDGCSSGLRTDLGARLNVLTTASAIKKVFSPSYRNGESIFEDTFIDKERDQSLATLSSELDLHPDDLLATCIYAIRRKDGRSFINIMGDGVVATKSANGEIWMSKFEWANNIPFYLSYRGRLNDFISAHGGNIHAKDKLLEESYGYKADGTLIESVKSSHDLATGIDGINIRIQDNVKYVALFTDGVTQIDQYEWQKAVLAMLAFKTTDGEFAKRRAIRELKNSFKIGKGPQDDFSYAVIGVSE